MKPKKIKKRAERENQHQVYSFRFVSNNFVSIARAKERKNYSRSSYTSHRLVYCMLFMCASSSKRLHTGYIQQTVIVFTWPLKSVRTLNNTMKLKTCSDRSLCVSFSFFFCVWTALWCCGWRVLQKKRLSLMLCGSSDFICRFLLMVTLAFSCGYPHRHFNIDAILGFEALYRPTTFTLLIHYWVVEVTV